MSFCIRSFCFGAGDWLFCRGIFLVEKCENIVYIAEFSADFFVGKSLAAGIRKVGFKIMDNFIGQCGIKRFQAFFNACM